MVGMSRFNVSSAIDIKIFRKSRIPLKQHLLAKWSGVGIDLMNIGKLIDDHLDI